MKKVAITTEVVDSLATAAELWGMDSATIKASKRRSDRVDYPGVLGPVTEQVKITFRPVVPLPHAVLRAAEKDLQLKGITTSSCFATSSGSPLKVVAQIIAHRNVK